MDRTILRLKDVGKRFYLTTRSERTVFKTFMRHLTGQEGQRELWALRGVNLDVAEGEVLGVIGANGAGKSTLLSIMAGIMDPTEGTVEREKEVRTPFLGLGAGMQPELGLEDNIRLCSALLGLSRKDCDERLEKILAFGGLEPYRHAKLSELSSGYQMRVAFATAFHTDSDFLIIDESMAAGDMQFKEKCMRKFEEYLAQKKTIVLVSHEMGAIREICGRCLYLRDGRQVALGPTDEVALLYEQDCAAKIAAQTPEGA